MSEIGILRPFGPYLLTSAAEGGLNIRLQRVNQLSVPSFALEARDPYWCYVIIPSAVELECRFLMPRGNVSRARLA